MQYIKPSPQFSGSSQDCNYNSGLIPEGLQPKLCCSRRWGAPAYDASEPNQQPRRPTIKDSFGHRAKWHTRLNWLLYKVSTQKIVYFCLRSATKWQHKCLRDHLESGKRQESLTKWAWLVLREPAFGLVVQEKPKKQPPYWGVH